MSTTAWNLDALRDHVRVQGQNGFDPVSRAVRAISKMVDVFHFHAYAAKDAFAGFIKEGEEPTEEHLLLIFGASERQKDFAYARLASEAHLLGTLLATRSMYDFFSQIVNELLLASKLGERACNIHTVRASLPTGRLRGDLDSLLTSDWFRYVHGFVNLSKHRYMVEHGVSLTTATNSIGVEVGAFNYGKDKWSAKRATEVLEGAFEVKNHISKCGRALNAACGIVE